MAILNLKSSANLHVKPFELLTPGKKFFRQNMARLIIYGGFLLVLYWSVSKILEIKETQDAKPQPNTETKAV